MVILDNLYGIPQDCYSLGFAAGIECTRLRDEIILSQVRRTNELNA